MSRRAAEWFVQCCGFPAAAPTDRARHRMVILGESAAQAVGYHSASHFSRDYRAVYGAPPAADAARSRTRLHL